MNEKTSAQEAPRELDPRAAAMQAVADCERRVQTARWERDRAVRVVEKAEEELSEARAAAAELLGVRESELAGAR
jgi:hypothetical protein